VGLFQRHNNFICALPDFLHPGSVLVIPVRRSIHLCTQRGRLTSKFSGNNSQKDRPLGEPRRGDRSKLYACSVPYGRRMAILGGHKHEDEIQCRSTKKVVLYDFGGFRRSLGFISFLKTSETVDCHGRGRGIKQILKTEREILHLPGGFCGYTASRF
jgi:hypothetical protein